MIDTFKREIISRYTDFSGRTNRHDFWTTILASFLLGIILGVVSAILGKIGATLTSIVGLLLLIPSLALSVRRLNDIGKPWYTLFLSLIPIVGFIILIIFYCKESK